MTPVVRRVPTCFRCKGTFELVLGDGPVICHECIRLCVRLALIRRTDYDEAETRPASREEKS